MCTAATLTVWTAHCTPWPTKLAPINSSGRCAAADPSVLARPLAMRTRWLVRVSAEARADVGDSAQRCALHISAMRRDAAERKVHRFVRRPKVKLLSESKPVTYVRKGPVYTCARSRLPEGSALRTASHCSAPLRSALCSARLGSDLFRAFLVPKPNQCAAAAVPAE